MSVRRPLRSGDELSSVLSRRLRHLPGSDLLSKAHSLERGHELETNRAQHGLSRVQRWPSRAHTLPNRAELWSKRAQHGPQRAEFGRTAPGLGRFEPSALQSSEAAAPRVCAQAVAWRRRPAGWLVSSRMCHWCEHLVCLLLPLQLAVFVF